MARERDIEVAGEAGREPRLSPRMRTFCDEFILDPAHDAEAAYVRAGYSADAGDVRMAVARLMAKPQVVAYLRKMGPTIPEVEQGMMLENRGMCIDLWRRIVRARGELDGEECPLSLRLAASKELAKACGLHGAGPGASPTRAQVNVNVAGGGVGIDISDPYAVASGAGEVVEIAPEQVIMGGDDGDAD
ncbi:MAG: terminase small subunit [Akkermansia sp.]|nr:terminase small subunit [Akkermansia sp.]